MVGPRNILVWGAYGFMGRHLVQRLLSEGANVSILTRERSRYAPAPWDCSGTALRRFEAGDDPGPVFRRAVEGIERGDFFIVTHPHARGYADKRYAELSAAFDAQAPMKPGEERYDVTSIAMEVLAKGAS